MATLLSQLCINSLHISGSVDTAPMLGQRHQHSTCIGTVLGYQCTSIYVTGQRLGRWPNIEEKKYTFAYYAGFLLGQRRRRWAKSEPLGGLVIAIAITSWGAVTAQQTQDGHSCPY